MTLNNKIASLVAAWLVVTALGFLLVFPRVTRSLISLRQSYSQQIGELNELRDRAKALQRMQSDITKVKQEGVQPEELFTSDLKLVNEIQYIEKAAAFTGTDLKLAISGTADKAQAVPSASGLYQVPYTMTVQGKFTGVIKFLQQMENSYFISPVNGLTFNRNEDGTVNVTILSNFYIHRDPSSQVSPKPTEQ